LAGAEGAEGAAGVAGEAGAAGAVGAGVTGAAGTAGVGEAILTGWDCLGASVRLILTGVGLCVGA